MAATIKNGTLGADILIATTSGDTLIGDLGDDTYIINVATATITETVSGGTDLVITTQSSYTLGANLENLGYGGALGFKGTGNSLNNSITGSLGNDTLIGMAGDDTLNGGGGGNDSLSGGTGSDVLVGGGGNDTLDGGAITDKTGFTDANLASYDSAVAGVIVDLSKGTAQDGQGGADKLSNINMVLGSVHDDSITGSTTLLSEQFEGGAGDDTIDGGEIKDNINQQDNNRVSYQHAGAAVSVDLAAGSADGAETGHDTLQNITQVRGSAYNDQLLGSDNALIEQFEGLAGNDTIDGRGGIDMVSYESAMSGVTVDLAAGTASDGDWNTDTLSHIEGVIGSIHADSLSGGHTDNGVSVDDGGIEIFQGNGGNDTIDGGQGYDRADYVSSTAGVFADLGNQLANDGLGGTDTLLNIEGLRGSGFNDTLIGSDADYETFEGGAGNDSIDGKGGIDRVDYQHAKAGVVVNLTTGTATDGDGGTDKLAGIEDVRGSSFNDSITGGSGDNLLEGLGGNDTLVGGATGDKLDGGIGNDSLLGGDGDDLLLAGTGSDVADGGAGDGDVLELLSTFGSYTIKRSSATDVLLVNELTGESITARNVEEFLFTDGLKTLGDTITNVTSAYGDVMLGDAGDNVLDGLAGKDTMSGLAGDDTYTVDNIGDVVFEEADQGNDLVNVAYTAAAQFNLPDAVENATVTSASAAVGLAGNALANELTGNGAANTLTGNAGNDTLNGGAGNDILNGGDGNDSLDGGSGSDNMSGGDGDDRYLVDASGDVVTEAAGKGYDSVAVKLAAYTLAANVERLTFEGSGNFNGTGNLLANDMRGGAGNDTLSGGAGDDYLAGLAGNDSLLGGDGADVLEGGSGVDVIDGGAGADLAIVSGDFGDYTRSRPTVGDTRLVHNVTGDTITLRNVESVQFNGVVHALAEINDNLASPGDDVLQGTSGNDSMVGGAGKDSMSGLGGDDVYVVDVAGDVVLETAGQGTDLVQVAFTAAASYTLGAEVENGKVVSADTVAASLVGNELANVLTGNGAANMLTGNGGADELSGGAGKDTLLGGDGNDVLDGGLGTDSLNGGVGDDLYVVDVATDVATEAADGGYDTVVAVSAAYTLGANLERLSFEGSGNFTGTGNLLANDIAGGAGNDTLSGGAGNDQLSGGAGNDSLLGGDGNDVLDAGTGAADVADGGAGQDTLMLDGAFDDYVRSRSSATDTLLVNSTTGEAVTIRNVESVNFNGDQRTLAQVNYKLYSVGDDELVGTSGIDSINGLAGKDTMSGLDGSDVYTVDVAGDVVIEEEGQGIDLVNVAYTAAGSYTLADNVEYATVTATVAVNLVGNALNNRLTGNAAANVLTGNEGDDTLSGGAGNDTMIGGAGRDSYTVDAVGDVVTELAGGGSDTVRTTLAAYTLGVNVESLDYIGSAAFKGTGNDLGNEIGGGDGNDTLSGMGGSDLLAGGAGNDSLLGGDGDDLVYAGTGTADVVDGGAGDDRLVVLGASSDYVRSRVSLTDTKLVSIANGESIIIRNVETVVFTDGDQALAQVNDNLATSGNDTLTGTDGDDTLDGGLGTDDLSGGLGNDTYVLNVTTDVVHEAADQGTDLVKVGYTTLTPYALGEHIENATISSAAAIGLVGNALNNLLTGNAAANALTGNDGDDTLNGGAGNDTMTGGAGSDTYMVDAAGDVVVETAVTGDDSVITTLASYTLGANLDALFYNGSAAFKGGGNDLGNEMHGNVGNDTLSGMGGNDLLVGGAGNDSLLGGDGNDQLVAGTGSANVVDGGNGSDTLILAGDFSAYTRTRVSLTDTRLVNIATGESVTFRNVETVEFNNVGVALDVVNANLATSGNDTLTGTDGADTLDGGLGSDDLSGGAGNDTYVLNVTTDVVHEDADQGTDLVNVGYTTLTPYTLGDNIEHASVTSTAAIGLIGNALDNLLTGNAAANTLTGNDGSDTLAGGAGSDSMTGGAGNDLYYVDASGDIVVEEDGGGYDAVYAMLASYTLAANVEELAYLGSGGFRGTGNALSNIILGGSGNDTLSGMGGSDQLFGGAGNDSLLGGDGADMLLGGLGNDTLSGGDGADRFELQSATGVDTISDFTTGVDVIRLSRSALPIGNGNFTIDNGVVRTAAGGFGADAELVIFTANTGGSTASSAAAAIGSADGGFTLGQQVLFVLNNGSNSYLYLFKSGGTDALVSAGELSQIAILTGRPVTTLADYDIG